MPARRKVLVSVMAWAISPHNWLTSTPVSKREVMLENLCSCWLSSCSRELESSRPVDLSSSKVTIMPNATKYLGVFQSSGLMCRLGNLASRNIPRGKTAAHRTKPPALVITPGERRRYRIQKSHAVTKKARVNVALNPVSYSCSHAL